MATILFVWPVLALALLVFWTLVVMRGLTFRGILSERTLGTYLLIGLLYGPLALQTSRTLVAAAGHREWAGVVGLAAAPGLLMIPVLVLFFLSRTYRSASVADAFLLGFLVGFGFDLLALGFNAAAGVSPFMPLESRAAYGLNPERCCSGFSHSLFPPAMNNVYIGSRHWVSNHLFDFPLYSYSVAGNGYWVGLSTLVLAATLRFVRRTGVAVAVAVLCLAAGCLDSAFHMARYVGAQNQHLFSVVQVLTVRGALIPWVAMIAVVALSLYEARWVGRAVGTSSQTPGGIFEEWQALVYALVDRTPRELLRLKAFRLDRRLALAQAESSHSPGDETLRGLADGLRAERSQTRLQLARAVPGLESPMTVPDAFEERWPWRLWLQIGLSVVIAAILLLRSRVYMVGQGLGDPTITWARVIWSLPALDTPILQGLTPVALALVVLILWWFMAYPTGPASAPDVDNLMQFAGEKWILWTSLAMVMIALMYRKIENLYELPNWNGSTELLTLMLLLAAAASSTTLYRSEQFRRAPIGLRRASALRNLLALGVTFVVSWTSLFVFDRAQSLMFHRLGSLPSTLLAAVVTLSFAAAFIWVLLGQWKRAQAFLLGASRLITG